MRYVALSPEGANTLKKEAAAVAWVHDAFAHCKVIGATKGAHALLDVAGVEADQGVKIDPQPDAYLTAAAAGRIWERELKVRATY